MMKKKMMNNRTTDDRGAMHRAGVDRHDARAIRALTLMLSWLTASLTCAHIGNAARGQPDPSNPEPATATTPADQAGQEDGQDPDEDLLILNMGWQSKVGDRAGFARNAAPTVDMVVLVPDEATFVDAISHWGFDNGRWPILIEDDFYTPLFIRAFDPVRIVRWPQSDTPLPSGEALENTIRRTAAWTWRDPNPENQKPKDDPAYADPDTILRTAGWSPLGVVATSASDPAWPAAIALSSTYGQPIVFIDDDYGEPNGILRPEKYIDLNTRINEAVDSYGYDYRGLGDDFDTLTVVRRMASKYRNPADRNQILALTDGIARDDRLRRWGVAGWIYGSSTRAVYTAMSSIFAIPKQATLFNTYSTEREPWSEYTMGGASFVYRAVGIDVSEAAAPDADIHAWSKAAPEGLNSQVVFVNTSGGGNWFEISNGRAFTRDIPVPNVPTFVNFVHSWSAMRIDDPDTIAGRWFAYGAAAYIGAVDEPFLQAFAPPKVVSNLMAQHAPLLLAVRGQVAPPWKVMVYGDPLMIWTIRTVERVKPREASIDWPAGVVDLMQNITAVQRAVSEGKAEWSELLHAARRIGRDGLVKRWYFEALAHMESDDGSHVAEVDELTRIAMPSLLITATDRELREAYVRLSADKRSRMHDDMLWQRMNSHLKFTEDESLVAFLMEHVREPDPWIDAARLAPAIARVYGNDRANAWIDEHLAEVPADRKVARTMLENARPADQ